jgi:hypothetical protein
VSEPLYFSARLVRPFISLLRHYPEYPELVIAKLESVSCDQRIPISVGYKCLTDAVDRTGDPDIGLKAGRLR